MAVKVDHHVVRIMHLDRGHRTRDERAASVDHHDTDQCGDRDARFAQYGRRPRPGAQNSPNDQTQEDCAEDSGVLREREQR